MLLIIILICFPPRWGFRLAGHFFPGAIYFVETETKTIALTIDDGPFPNSTTEILDRLETHNVKATFFVISHNILEQESVIHRLVQAGHELGNHMTQDEASIRLTDSDFETKLLQADRVLSEYRPTSKRSGDNPYWLRPGMGWYNSQMIATAHQQGYQLALGSVFPYDTHVPSIKFAEWFILANIQPGDIVVLHDGKERGERTARLLDNVLPKLKHQGYEVVTLSELVKRDPSKFLF